MKKNEKTSFKYRKFLVFFILFYFFLLALLETSFFWDNILKIEKKIGYRYTKNVYKFHNNIDLFKKLKPTASTNFDNLALSISKKNLSELLDQVELFKEIGYQDDDLKTWFNADLDINGNKYKSKLKLHGTSSTWLKRDFLSFKVKQEKNLQYPLNVRRFNLINVQDKFIPYSDPLNEFASSLGLISPYGRLTNLSFNGTDMGLYYLVEDHKKEFLERNHGIVDYVMFSPLDNWTGTSFGHTSPHDLSYYYYEASGNDDENSLLVARGKLKHLLDAVRNEDIEKVLTLIDDEYASKFLALMYLFNDIHLVTGDNLRLIYDFHRGKFYPMFRLENLASEISIKKNTAFNYQLFESYDYSPTHDFFKLLVKNDDIRYKRDLVLWNIVENQEELINVIKNKYLKQNDVLLNSSVSRKRFKLHQSLLINNLTSNLNFIENYLKDSSLYILNEDATYFIVDSMIPIKNSKTNLKINNFLNNDLSTNFQKNKAKSNLDCTEMNSLDFYNAITNEELNPNNIRCIDSLDFSINQSWKESLNKFDVAYHYDEDKNLLEIKPGTYNILDNISFEKGLDVKLGPGVNLLLAENISVIIHGKFTSIGLENNPVTIRSLGNNPFGTIAVHSSDLTQLEYTEIENGSEAFINGFRYTGQISIYGGKVLINKSKFLNSKGDDGLNIKRSDFEITNSIFFGNYADQLDVDYSRGKIKNSTFSPIINNVDGDGIDLSNSRVSVVENMISNNGDKGVSIGESSNIYLAKNILKDNNKTIAVKDGSYLYLGDNSFLNLDAIIYLYKKKGFYEKPRVFMENNSTNDVNFEISDSGFVEKVGDTLEAFQQLNR